MTESGIANLGWLGGSFLSKPSSSCQMDFGYLFSLPPMMLNFASSQHFEVILWSTAETVVAQTVSVPPILPLNCTW